LPERLFESLEPLRRLDSWSGGEIDQILGLGVLAAKLVQAPFLSSISFGAAKEMDSAGRARKKLEERQ